MLFANFVKEPKKVHLMFFICLIKFSCCSRMKMEKKILPIFLLNIPSQSVVTNFSSSANEKQLRNRETAKQAFPC